MTPAERQKAILATRRARMEGRPVPKKYRGGASVNEPTRRKIHKIKGGNSKARTGRHKHTAKQGRYIQLLEEETGTPNRDITDFSRNEASDYIETLKFRRNHNQETQ